MDEGTSDESPSWEVFVAGGRTPTGIYAVAWAADGVARGAGEILLTSMDRDGTKDGYDIELVAAVSAAVPVPVIASGGVGTVEHLVDGLQAGADAVLAPRSSTSASTPCTRPRTPSLPPGSRPATPDAGRRTR